MRQQRYLVPNEEPETTILVFKIGLIGIFLSLIFRRGSLRAVFD